MMTGTLNAHERSKLNIKRTRRGALGSGTGFIRGDGLFAYNCNCEPRKSDSGRAEWHHHHLNPTHKNALASRSNERSLQQIVTSSPARRRLLAWNTVLICKPQFGAGLAVVLPQPSYGDRSGNETTRLEAEIRTAVYSASPMFGGSV